MLLSDAELTQLRSLAEEAGLSASDFMRARIRRGDDGMLSRDRGSIVIRSEMLRDDIERLRTSSDQRERDRAALDARSALGHMLWHVDRLLGACGLDRLPDYDPAPTELRRTLPRRKKK